MSKASETGVARATLRQARRDAGAGASLSPSKATPSPFVIAVESPLSDDVRAMVQALNEYTFALTPAEYRHHMTVEQMAQPDTTLFVARDENGTAIGMGALRRHADGVAEVKRMFVKPYAQGRGVGGAILAAIEDRAREEGFSRLVLETGSNFDAARRLYERGAFSACAQVLDYPPSPWTAFYAKELRV